MQITYKLRNKKPIVKTSIVSSEPNKALFYVVKNPSYSYDIQFSDSLSFKPTVYSESFVRGKYKVTANTSDVSITNIILDGVPYFYEVVTSDRSALTKEYVELNTPYAVEEYNGRLYTESYCKPFEVSVGISLLTVPVITDDMKVFSYTSKGINISVNSKEKCAAKANQFSAQFVTQSTVRLPSIYIEKNKKTLRVVESDVQLLTKKELVSLQGNRVEPKGCVFKYDKSVYVLDVVSNTLHVEEPSLTCDDTVIEYTELYSSHIKALEDNLYLEVRSGGYAFATKDSFDIKITKKQASDFLHVYPNPYLNTYSKTLPNLLGISYSNISDSVKRSCTEYVETSSYLDVSKVHYVITDSLKIFQKYSTTFNVKPADLSLIYEYTDNVNNNVFKVDRAQLYSVSSIKTSYSYEEV